MKRSSKSRRQNRPPSNRAWLAAHPQGPTSSKPKYLKSRPLLLRCSNEYFCAGAIWVRREGHWVCDKAAPILAWMIGLQPSEAKFGLLKRGCSWSWIGGHSGKLNGLSQNNAASNSALDSSSKVNRPLETSPVLQPKDPVAELTLPQAILHTPPANPLPPMQAVSSRPG